MVGRKSSQGASLRRLLPWLILSAFVVFADQLTKQAVLNTLHAGEVRPFTSFFSLVLTFNKGAAFSFLANASGWQDEFFTTVGICAALFILWLLARHGAQTVFSLALALILGGAIGNVTDRLMYGHVVDFLLFHYKGWSWPAFNVADSAIVCGAATLILDELRRVRRAD
jgi:signal peptidase II